ncbi:MAG: helix-turn-helix domain-containing protein [Desulfitobacteriaceae bacterium]
MGIVENIKALCKQRDTSIPRIEKELGFGNGAIYNWDKNSPTIGKLQQVADHMGVSVDFLISGFDKEIIDLIKELSAFDLKKGAYFHDDVLAVLTPEIERLKKEYWDVPIDMEPIEMISLIRETPLSVEYKNDLLNVLKEVKEKLNIGNGSLDTLAAHHAGEEWTEEELTDIERFKEFVRSKRNTKS